MRMPNYGHQFDVDHDEDGSRLIVSVVDEGLCLGTAFVQTPIGAGYAQFDDADIESFRLKLDHGDALKLYETLEKNFGETWAMLRQVQADVAAGRGPNGEPAGTWEPDRDPDEGYDRDDPKHPTWGERFAAGADYARKAARENA